MTDAISTAQQISNCESTNTQSTMHASWTGLNGLQVIARNPEFKPYMECLVEKYKVLTGDDARKIPQFRNQAREMCLPVFLTNQKSYCANKVKNSSSTSPTSDDLLTAESQRNKDLIAATAEAKAQKILTDKEEELIAKQNKLIEDSKTILSNIASRGLSDNPVVAAVIQPVIQDVLDEIIKKAAEFAKERAKKSRNTLANNVKAFSYPMKPLPPQPITPLAEDVPPAEPVIEPLPTTYLKSF